METMYVAVCRAESGGGLIFSHSSACRESGRTLTRTVGGAGGGKAVDRRTTTERPDFREWSVYSEDIPAPLRTPPSLSVAANKTDPPPHPPAAVQQ